MKIFLSIICFLILSGCGGYNSYLDKNLPNAGFDKLIIKTDFGPIFSIGVQAEGAIKDGNDILIDKLTYDRTGNFSSTHIYIDGYHRTLPEEGDK